MRGALLFAPVLALLLAACAAPKEFAQAPPPPSTIPAAGCNAEAAQFAVGQAYGEAIADQVKMRSGASAVRALRPGQAVTMEFIADRVNLDLDAAGKITRVRCG